MSHRDLGFGNIFDELGKPRTKMIWSTIGHKAVDAPRLGKNETVFLTEKINLNVSRVQPHYGFLNNPVHGQDGELVQDGIAAGYTYLFQLAAHDVVQTAQQARPFDDYDAKAINLRREPLALETVFGGGPIGCPHAYERDRPDGVVPLRTGLFGDEISGHQTRHEPAHDLPRARYNGHGPEDHSADYAEVLIADARNDDNNILAQLTVLFHRLYNLLVQKTPDVAGADGEEVRKHHRARIARLATIRIYHRILRQDLLPRLMHKDILKRYDPNFPQPILGLPDADTIDLFAFGAARAAHSMVRSDYSLSADFRTSIVRIINTSSLHVPANVPTPKSWQIDWSLFFPAPPSTDDRINWAIRLGPHLTSGMQTATAATSVGDGLPTGTLMRDFLGEYWAGLPPVPFLLSQLDQAGDGTGPFGHETLPDIIKRVVDAGLRTIDAGLMETNGDGEAIDLSMLHETPPLILFLLFEAWSEGDRGRTFGPLGSAILGDCLLPLIQKRNPTSVAEQDAALLEKAVFPGTQITTMPALLAQLDAAAAV